MHNRAPALLLILACVYAPAQERNYGRSLVISQRGIVATSQTLASQAGAQILARGGSAVDAAIAANAVLGVVEPMMNGIGGDLFAIHWNAKTGKFTALNASGWTPKRISVDALKKQGHYSMPYGIHTVTVPGAVDGWARMHARFGKLPWRDLFQPAIFYAANGFPVTEFIQWDWDNSSGKLRADENARRVFLRDGEPPKTGEIFKNPELARALTLLANGGAQAFYHGPIGEAILKTSKRLGGFLATDDFVEFQSEWVEPISTEYRGWKVYQLPPNGQGVGTLEMLNIMARFPIGDFGFLSPEAWHFKIEAQKLTVQDLRRWVGDPRAAAIPTAGLMAPSYAAERAKLIDPQKANCDFGPGEPPMRGGRETIYLSVIDADGNIVSWIQSISDIFGSGIVVDGMGFHLHDRASGMNFEPGHPNQIGPRKRPFHTIIPGFMEKGDLHIGFGIMRGMNQAQAQAQFVSNVADHEMNIQAALEAPRFTRPLPGGCGVVIERRVPDRVRDALGKMGHNLNVVSEYSGLMGGGQAVMRDSKNGMNYGASSPRKDGAAIPEPDPYFPKSK